MDNKDYKSKGNQENWSHDKYGELNRDEKTFKNSKKRPYNSYKNEHHETKPNQDSHSQYVNNKTLNSDFMDQPKKHNYKRPKVRV